MDIKTIKKRLITTLKFNVLIILKLRINLEKNKFSYILGSFQQQRYRLEFQLVDQRSNQFHQD